MWDEGVEVVKTDSERNQMYRERYKVDFGYMGPFVLNVLGHANI